MKHRTLGKTGYKVSEIGLGCWQLGGDFGPVSDAQSEQIINEAIKYDINFFDTADVYGAGMSESRLGEVLTCQGDRAPYVVSKVGRDGALFPDGYTKEKVRANIQGTMDRLQVTTLDLVQLHCIPPAMLASGEIFTWLDELVDEGMIRHYGASVETIAEAKTCLQYPNLATLQIIFNIFRQDAITELFDEAEKANVGIIVRLPLASGLLSGKMRVGHQFDQNDHRNYNADGQCFSVGETFSGIQFDLGIELVEQLKSIVGSDVPLSQIALRWILDFPAVSSIIAGVSKPEQIALNALASDLPPLSVSVHQQLSEFYKTKVNALIRCEI